MNARREEAFKRKCKDLVRKINSECQTFVPKICYKEFLHNVYYDKKVCYCDNLSERMLKSSEIEICRYKNRIKVIMYLATRYGLTDEHKKKINKILRTNVKYENLELGYAEISFNVNPHKM